MLHIPTRPYFPEKLAKNHGVPLDQSWINQCVSMEQKPIERAVADILSRKQFAGKQRILALLHAVGCIDLTTLAGDDTPSKVAALCSEAVHPLPDLLVQKLAAEFPASKATTCGAVCVYPNRIRDAVRNLDRLHAPNGSIGIASVAAGFPAGLYPLETRVREVKLAVEAGATEIDIVIDRSLVLTGRWETLYEEIKALKLACGEKAKLKTILGVGELLTLTNVYKASIVAMQAGSDTIKTSTGKETINATLPIGLCMLLAIRDYYERTDGVTVGLKPAGGIKTADEVLSWLVLVHAVMGDLYLQPKLFRVGASSLLGNIVKDLEKLSK